jgi:hypothetical protein
MRRTLTMLDRTHERLIRTVSGLDTQTFETRPGSEYWSISEVVYHLCLVEENILLAMEKSRQNGNGNPIGLLNWLKPISLVGIRTFKVQAPKFVEPLNPPDQGTALSKFEQKRFELKKFALETGTHGLRHTSFKHPFLGIIDGIGALSFLHHHERRHLKQIEAILRKLHRRS